MISKSLRMHHVMLAVALSVAAPQQQQKHKPINHLNFKVRKSKGERKRNKGDRWR